MPQRMGKTALPRLLVPLAALLAAAAVSVFVFHFPNWSTTPASADKPILQYRPRQGGDVSGFTAVVGQMQLWGPAASLEEVSSFWTQGVAQFMAAVDQRLGRPDLPDDERIQGFLTKAFLHNYQGEASQAYQVLEHARALAEGNDAVAEEWLFTLIYCQGVTALRRGEDENCVQCRGESACILPIAPSAVHTKPFG